MNSAYMLSYTDNMVKQARAIALAQARGEKLEGAENMLLPATLIAGKPGAGKSTIVPDRLRMHNGRGVKLALSRMTLPGLVGLYLPGTDAQGRKVTEHHPPEWVHELMRIAEEVKKEYQTFDPQTQKLEDLPVAYLFLDDMAHLNQAAMPYFMSLLYDRLLSSGKVDDNGNSGGIVLPPYVIIFATNNRLTDNATGAGMIGSAIGTRGIGLEFEIELGEWMVYATKNGEADPLVKTFLLENPNMFSTVPDAEDGTMQRGFPCPRAWSELSRGFILNRDILDAEFVASLTRQTVGKVAADRMVIHYATFGKLTPVEDSVLGEAGWPEGEVEGRLSAIRAADWMSGILTALLPRSDNGDVKKIVDAVNEKWGIKREINFAQLPRNPLRESDKNGNLEKAAALAYRFMKSIDGLGQEPIVLCLNHLAMGLDTGARMFVGTILDRMEGKKLLSQKVLAGWKEVPDYTKAMVRVMGG